MAQNTILSAMVLFFTVAVSTLVLAETQWKITKPGSSTVVFLDSTGSQSATHAKHIAANTQVELLKTENERAQVRWHKKNQSYQGWVNPAQLNDLDVIRTPLSSEPTRLLTDKEIAQVLSGALPAVEKSLNREVASVPAVLTPIAIEQKVAGGQGRIVNATLGHNSKNFVSIQYHSGQIVTVGNLDPECSASPINSNNWENFPVTATTVVGCITIHASDANNKKID